MNEYAKMAREFAICAHGEQKYGSLPYVFHLDHVYSLVHMVGAPTYMDAAAFLHDIVEDTDVDLDSVREKFGNDVASLVWAVTDEPGKNRRERKERTLPKIREHGRYAVLLKLCDRVANVQNSALNGGSGLFQIYKKEQQGFRAALYSPHDGYDRVWDVLDLYLGWS